MKFTFEVSGKYAMFAEPSSRAGGEFHSYPVPTYEALKGIAKAIYWKPTIDYVVKRVRVMDPIAFYSTAVDMIFYSSKDGRRDPRNSLYLQNVGYQVEVEMIWNENHPEFEKDRCEKKHVNMFLHALERGGRRNPCLGKTECVADVKPCKFGEGSGVYDFIPQVCFGPMFHSFTYPDGGYDEHTRTHITANFWNVVMENGIITFPEQRACAEAGMSRTLRKMSIRTFPEKHKVEESA